MKAPYRALPWIASALLHALILLVPLGFLMSQSPLMGFTSGGSLEMAVALPSTGVAALGGTGGLPVSSSDRMNLPRPASNSLKKSPQKMSYSSPQGVLEVEGPSPLSTIDSIPSPTAQEVLNDLPVAATAASAPATAQIPDPSHTAEPGGAQIVWTQSPRKLIRRPDSVFPTVLSANGQEVEVEARITVSPAGRVTRVEITRSSGYDKVDASVEVALFDYLFSRVDGRSDTVGTVTFRFRLEKQD